eukprot:TRINITY_DN1696_c0_g1_i1.p1 TRINITY_DN1696_c0_g1~~TRINITY_DN1696_c0_g1_i1.p1  ORF type:complete len:1384 (+),score=481.56 TRINITY_DN1696_c0_g1_i1:436-4587(+)
MELSTNDPLSHVSYGKEPTEREWNSTVRHSSAVVLNKLPIPDKLNRLLQQILSEPPLSYSDGLTREEVIQLSSVNSEEEAKHELLTNLKALGLFGASKDIYKTLKLVLHLKKRKPLKDRQLQVEDLIHMMYRIPTNTKTSKLLNDLFIKSLWAGLSHPPASFVGENFRTPDGKSGSSVFIDLGKAGSPYARSVEAKHPLPSVLPDPSTIFDAVMGREEFTPHPSGVSANLFYFATLIIHDLFHTAHDSQADPHREAKQDIGGGAEGKHTDATVKILGNVPAINNITNNTSSYLDLAPLYGNNEKQQALVRLGRDGLLKPDTFADQRILMMLPGVCAVVVLFNRNHNRIAEKLKSINEEGRFTVNPNVHGQSEAEVDQKIFQTARYINCCTYMNIITHDYLLTILGINTSASSWTLDPTKPIVGMGHEPSVPLGTGNQNSIEFNLVYRWHSSISEEDTQWMEEEYKKKLGLKPDEKITVENLRSGFPKLLRGNNFYKDDAKPSPANLNSPDQWTFNGISRDPVTGKFPDAEIFKIMRDGTDRISGKLGAKNVPEVLKVVEILGILQSRQWGVCSLNEFRKFIGCNEYHSFSEINPDPKIADALEKLYHHPDNVELYPGLIAEETKPSRPGSGLCPGYSTSRAILFDAVALVRGDRLFTHGYNPRDLTAWGFADCQGSPDVAQGAVFNKLLFGGLPGRYKPNSIYALYPFTVPSFTEANLSADPKEKRPERRHLFDLQRPDESTFVAPWVNVSNYQEVTRILNNPEDFTVRYETKMNAISKDNGYFLAWDNRSKHDHARDAHDEALISATIKKEYINRTKTHSAYLSTVGNNPKIYEEELKKFYREVTRTLLKKSSYHIPGMPEGQFNVNIVNNVANIIPVHFVAEYLLFSLKTDWNYLDTFGVFTEQELYLQLSALFVFLFLDLDDSKSFSLKLKAIQASDTLAAINSILVKRSWLLGKILTSLSIVPVVGESLSGKLRDFLRYCGFWSRGADFAQALRRFDMTEQEIIYNMIGTAIGAVATQGQALSQTINFYLGDSPFSPPSSVPPTQLDLDKQEALKDLIQLAQLDTEEADERILGYILEAGRLNIWAKGVFRIAAKDTQILIEDNTSSTKTHVPHQLKKGESVFIDMHHAMHQGDEFKNPERIDPKRPKEKYIIFGHGFHECYGKKINHIGLVASFKEILKLKNLQRVPGKAGKFQSFLVKDVPLYLTEYGKVWPFPTSLILTHQTNFSTGEPTLQPPSNLNIWLTSLLEFLQFKIGGRYQSSKKSLNEVLEERRSRLSKEEVPEQFLCSRTKVFMKDPVAVNGVVCERSAVHPTEASNRIVPQHKLKSQILEFLRCNNKPFTLAPSIILILLSYSVLIPRLLPVNPILVSPPFPYFHKQ